jgi:manganese/zinc/iron transport system ATP- binding protein
MNQSVFSSSKVQKKSEFVGSLRHTFEIMEGKSKMSSAENAIEIENLIVSYHHKPVLWDIQLSLPAGQIIGIIGPNGSGKTTLLKSIMGLLPLDSGTVRFFGKPIKEVRGRLSYVPQRESVDWDFPANVRDVVLMGRYRKDNLFKRLSKEDHRIANEAIEKVGLTDLAKRQIAQLSGGQQQRVFIARALAQQADIYLMDEPFVGVDAATEDAILKLLAEMRDEGKTVIIVHHDLQTAYSTFDWVVLLRTRLIASGPKSEVFTAKNLQNAYGGKLSILSRLGDILSEEEIELGEKEPS